MTFERSLLFIFLICWSSPAFATVRNTKHDFSAFSSAIETCAYCHSVHNSAGGLGRPAYMGALPDITDVYNSVTLDHEITTNSVNQSDAPLCLTCHDGTSLADMADVTTRTELEVLIVGTNKDLTLDLSNDHPVGFVYDASLDDGIVDPLPPVYVTYGPNRNEMWCSTCHDVHDNTYPPFLTMSNEGSALCYNCHIK